MTEVPPRLSMEEKNKTIDRSAGGPQYRRIINLLIAILFLTCGILAIEAITARTTSQRAARSAAANTVEVIEHRIASEKGRECVTKFIQEIIASQSREEARAVEPCAPEDIPKLEAALEIAKKDLRSVDPNNPLLKLDISPPTTRRTS